MRRAPPKVPFLLLLASACGPLSPAGPTSPVGAGPGPVRPSWSPSPLRLCAWNVRKLGHGSRTDYALVARVIEEGCDLVVLVEVMQKKGGHPGYDELLETLQRHSAAAAWSGVLTDAPRPRTASGAAEHYAMLWRADRLMPCDEPARLIYHLDHDGSDAGQGPDLFRREPAFCCYRSRATPPEAPGWRGPDFVLGAYHARWQDGDEAAIAGEVSHLGEVFAAMATAHPGERDLLLLGDLNLRPERLRRTVPFLDHTAVGAGAGRGSTLNHRGERTDNLYDHLLVHDPSASTELLGPATVMDVRGVAASPEAFFRHLSDHLPIVVKLDPSVADDD
jgi:endonuclease/exonuclease/phosphatase family metal-dependent hydrolase